MTKLTDKTIRSAKPRDKPYKLFDGQGLYLLVNPNGSKYWRMKYRFQGKEKLLSLGVFDPPKSTSISLSEARRSLKSLHVELGAGVDPGRERKRKKRQDVINGGNTFSVLAREWWVQQKGMCAYSGEREHLFRTNVNT